MFPMACHCCRLRAGLLGPSVSQASGAGGRRVFSSSRAGWQAWGAGASLGRGMKWALLAGDAEPLGWFRCAQEGTSVAVRRVLRWCWKGRRGRQGAPGCARGPREPVPPLRSRTPRGSPELPLRAVGESPFGPFKINFFWS